MFLKMFEIASEKTDAADLVIRACRRKQTERPRGVVGPSLNRGRERNVPLKSLEQLLPQRSRDPAIGKFSPDDRSKFDDVQVYDIQIFP